MMDYMSAEITFMQRHHSCVAIIGGGFSGAMLAVQLLRQASCPLTVKVVDRTGAPGRGIAYGTQDEQLFLNVPASRMSAFHDDPGHFVRWLQSTGSWVKEDAFAPRSLYGQYIGAIFSETCESCPECTVSWIVGDVVSIYPEYEGLWIVCRDGPPVYSDFVVLATGNEQPAWPSCLSGLDKDILRTCAWSQEAVSGVPMNGTVLLLGTGLTAVDQITSLQENGFRGNIVALSRRGHLPAAHAEGGQTCSTEWLVDLPESLLPLFTLIKRQLRLAVAAGTDWRPVVDCLRPLTSDIWVRLSYEDRARFIRHLQSFWVHARHRIPQHTSLLVDKLQSDRRLRVLAASFLGAHRNGNQALITFRKRGCTQVETVMVDRIINCIGPGSPTHISNPLYTQLIEQGIARRDALDLGVDTTISGCVISSDGLPSNRIFALGSLRKPSLWETTAVAEIRVQCALLAGALLAQCAAHDALHSSECAGLSAV